MRLRGDENPSRVPVEGCQPGQQAVKLAGCEPAGRDGMFQRPVWIETPHDHQPVDDFTLSADRKTVA